jgi:hypothetical protein
MTACGSLTGAIACTSVLSDATAVSFEFDMQFIIPRAAGQIARIA